jgi:hypothetical protein
MRIVVSIWIFLLFFAGLFAQDYDTVNIIAKQSRSNVLYVGIDNVILFPTLNQDSIFLTTTNGMIFRDSGRFVIIPEKPGYARILVYKLGLQKDSLVIGTNKLQTRRFPKPELLIDNLKLNDVQQIPKGLLLSADSINIQFSDDIIGIDNWYSIKGFTFGYIYGNHYLSFENEGNRFNKESKKSMYNLRPGDEIIIRVWLESNMNLSIRRPIFKKIVY